MLVSFSCVFILKDFHCIFIKISALSETCLGEPSDTTDFFPDIQNNLTKLSWAHAVNNASYLEKVLSGMFSSQPTKNNYFRIFECVISIFSLCRRRHDD